MSSLRLWMHSACHTLIACRLTRSIPQAPILSLPALKVRGLLEAIVSETSPPYGLDDNPANWLSAPDIYLCVAFSSGWSNRPEVLGAGTLTAMSYTATAYHLYRAGRVGAGVFRPGDSKWQKPFYYLRSRHGEASPRFNSQAWAAQALGLWFLNLPKTATPDQLSSVPEWVRGRIGRAQRLADKMQQRIAQQKR
jgi:hypothetical protein